AVSSSADNPAGELLGSTTPSKKAWGMPPVRVPERNESVMVGRLGLFRSTTVVGMPSESSSLWIASTHGDPAVTSRTLRSTPGGRVAAPAGPGRPIRATAQPTATRPAAADPKYRRFFISPLSAEPAGAVRVRAGW